MTRAEVEELAESTLDPCSCAHPNAMALARGALELCKRMEELEADIVVLRENLRFGRRW